MSWAMTGSGSRSCCSRAASSRSHAHQTDSGWRRSRCRHPGRLSPAPDRCEPHDGGIRDRRRIGVADRHDGAISSPSFERAGRASTLSRGRCSLLGDRCGRDGSGVVGGGFRLVALADRHPRPRRPELAGAGPGQAPGLGAHRASKRRRATRWLSMLLGALVVATVVLGVLHATGLWHGVGYWSALWTHVLLVAFVAPLLVWHIASRPGRPGIADLDRRAFVGGGIALGSRGCCVLDPATGGGRQPAIHRLARDRLVQPRRDADNDVAQRPVAPGGRLRLGAHRRRRASEAQDPLRPVLRPCKPTSTAPAGWWSRQSWDAVPLAELLARQPTRPRWKSHRSPDTAACSPLATRPTCIWPSATAVNFCGAATAPRCGWSPPAGGASGGSSG